MFCYLFDILLGWFPWLGRNFHKDRNFIYILQGHLAQSKCSQLKFRIHKCVLCLTSALFIIVFSWLELVVYYVLNASQYFDS